MGNVFGALWDRHRFTSWFRKSIFNEDQHFPEKMFRPSFLVCLQLKRKVLTALILLVLIKCKHCNNSVIDFFLAVITKSHSCRNFSLIKVDKHFPMHRMYTNKFSPFILTFPFGSKPKSFGLWFEFLGRQKPTRKLQEFFWLSLIYFTCFTALQLSI